MEKKLTNAITNHQKKEINDKIKYANKSTNTIHFSTKTMNPKGILKESEGDDRLIKRAFKACNALKTPPYYRQTALFTITKNFLTDKQRYIIENSKTPNLREYLKLC